MIRYALSEFPTSDWRKAHDAYGVCLASFCFWVFLYQRKRLKKKESAAAL